MSKKTTVLRVKRHRDELPPPDTFTLRPKASSVSQSAPCTDSNYNNSSRRKKLKAKEESDNATLLTNLIQNSTFFQDDGAISSSTVSKPFPSPSESRSNDCNTDITSVNKNQKAIVFRRVTSGEMSSTQCNGDQMSHTTCFASTAKAKTNNSKNKRKLDVVHVVNARLDSRKGNEREFPPECKNQSKRKRLSLQMVDSSTMTQTEFLNIQQRQSQAIHKSVSTKYEPPPSKSTLSYHINNHLILDPILKQIDDNLRSLTNMIQSTETHTNNSGTSTIDATALIAAHCELLQQQQKSSLTHTMKRYLNWKCTNGIGTILHIAALSNSAQSVKNLCRVHLDVMDLDLLDRNGHDALQVANMCGSLDVVEVLSRYRGISASAGCNDDVSGERESEEEERDGDYVFDLYCLTGDDEEEAECRGETYEKASCSIDKEQGNERSGGQRDIMMPDEKKELFEEKLTVGTQPTQSTFSESIGEESSENNSCDKRRPTVEMCGGVGYWNEHGELVLEVTDKMTNSDGNFGNIINDEDDEDEYDSNCEGYEGNDYPDEDERFGESSSFSYGGDGFQSDTSDDDNECDQNFRNLPVDLSNCHDVDRGGGFYNNTNYIENDDDQDYINYELSANLTSTPWSNGKREFAYDPDIDGQ